jgi:hypothetical protein
VLLAPLSGDEEGDGNCREQDVGLPIPIDFDCYEESQTTEEQNDKLVAICPRSAPGRFQVGFKFINSIPAFGRGSRRLC